MAKKRARKRREPEGNAVEFLLSITQFLRSQVLVVGSSVLSDSTRFDERQIMRIATEIRDINKKLFHAMEPSFGERRNVRAMVAPKDRVGIREELKRLASEEELSLADFGDDRLES